VLDEFKTKAIRPSDRENLQVVLSEFGDTPLREIENVPYGSLQALKRTLDDIRPQTFIEGRATASTKYITKLRGLLSQTENALEPIKQAKAVYAPQIQASKKLSNLLNIKLCELGVDCEFSKFDVGIEEYSLYLNEHALKHQEQNIGHTHILKNKDNNDIIAYITLVTDSILLTPAEKDTALLSSIPFSTLPAMKIGKLAVHKSYSNSFSGIGSFMIEVARGFAFEVNSVGVACRFLTIDADVEHNPTVTEFYMKNGFISNSHEKFRKQT